MPSTDGGETSAFGVLRCELDKDLPGSAAILAASATEKLRSAGAVLEEGPDPDAGVLGGEDATEELVLEVQAGRERAFEALVDGLLGVGVGHQGAAAELGRPGQRRVDDVRCRHHPVDESDAQRLLGAD